MASSEQATGAAASRLIDQRIRDLGDWRGETLARMRALILEAEPDAIEEWKWMGTPVWSCHGIICTGESYKKVVKLTFAKGASLPDPTRLFNSSLEGNTRRAIDLPEGAKVDARAFKALVKAAVALNGVKAKPKAGVKTAKAGVKTAKAGVKTAAKAGVKTTAKAGVKAPKAPKAPKASAKAPVLLSGGNPQIAKGDGDAPVQAYIAAMPGWKRAVGERLDALLARSVPGVRKAVKWNSPFYGVEGQGWFLGIHVFARYVKVAFFRGAALRPLPPGAGTGTNQETRYLDIHEDDAVDEAQLAAWVKQAAALPGWSPGRPA